MLAARQLSHISRIFTFGLGAGRGGAAGLSSGFEQYLVVALEPPSFAWDDRTRGWGQLGSAQRRRHFPRLDDSTQQRAVALL